MINSLPTLLVFSAIDGTGGAGTISDYCVASQSGCLPLMVITSITAQNLNGVQAVWALAPAKIKAQLQSLKQPLPSAIKVGVIGKAATTIIDYAKNSKKPLPPLVWDPVLSPTKGKDFLQQKDWKNLQKNFLPYVFVATPNRQELLTLSGERTINTAIKKWHTWGGGHVLVTDIDGKGKTIRHALFSASHTTPDWEYSCSRRPTQFHGTGCYFSTALAAALAHKINLIDAIASAQKKTEQAIDQAISLPSLGKQKLLNSIIKQP